MSGISGSCGDYSFEYDAYVCVDADGTLKVYWDSLCDCDGNYQLILQESNWDGSEVKAQYDDNCMAYGCGNTSIAVTRVNSTTVQIRWWADCADANCGQLSDAGQIGSTFEVELTPGAGCSVPSDEC